MAGAEVIGAAIGVMLLIIVGYLLFGSTLASAETVLSAQKDLTLQNEARLQTSIDISSSVTWGSPTSFTVTNTGSEPISDFTHMDVILFGVRSDGGPSPPWTYSYGSGWSHGTITPNLIHPNMLDPGEQMVITVNNNVGVPGPFDLVVPSYVQVICANGVYTYSS